MKTLAILLTLVAIPAFATEGALPKDQAIALAFADSGKTCSAEGGTLRLPEGDPATAVDMTGDGTADDWIINEAGAFCGPDLGYLGGSGGSYIHAVIGNRVESWLAGGWMIHDLGFTIEGEELPAVRMLLLGLHGSNCNSFGVSPCVLAVTWDGARLISVLSE